MSDIETAGANERAAIMVDVYQAPDGYRWRIKSSSRNRRILTVSSEAYVQKAAAMHALLLTTGGEYHELYRTTAALNQHTKTGTVITQGVIVRGIPGGLVEEIFVEYVR